MRPDEAAAVRELSATNADAANRILLAARLLSEAAGDIASDKALTEADRHDAPSWFLNLTVALLSAAERGGHITLERFSERSQRRGGLLSPSRSSGNREGQGIGSKKATGNAPAN